MSGFDAEAFMNQQTEGPMATYLPPPDEGDYMARVGSEPDDVKLEPVQGTKDPTKTYVRLTLMWDVIDEALKAKMQREKIRVRDGFLIDFDENGILKNGPEDNTALGSRRAALGLNDGPFSISMLRGAGPCMLHIGHRTDQNDKEKKYANVTRAVALAR